MLLKFIQYVIFFHVAKEILINEFIYPRKKASKGFYVFISIADVGYLTRSNAYCEHHNTQTEIKHSNHRIDNI